MDAAGKQAVFDRLMKIKERNAGVLQAEQVVKDARSAKSPLHDMFEWDDGVAAHKHRLDQARRLIRSVKVEIRVESKRIMAPYYVRDVTQDSGDQGYVAVADIKDESDIAKESLKYEFQRAIALFERAMRIAEVLGIEAELDDLLARTIVLRDRMAA